MKAVFAMGGKTLLSYTIARSMRFCRLVLAASSPYFRAMFTYNVVESTQAEIEIKGVNYQTVETVVDYLYTGQVEIDDDNAQDLLITCSMLQVRTRW